MRLVRIAPRSMSLALAVGAAAIGAGAAAGAASHPVRVTIRPAAGRPHTRFVVRFRAPARSRASGGTVSGYMVSASLKGRAPGHCTSNLPVPADPKRQGQRVRVVLRTRGRWCRGRYDGRLKEIVSPQCAPGAVCARSLALITVGRFSFRVR